MRVSNQYAALIATRGPMSVGDLLRSHSHVSPLGYVTAVAAATSRIGCLLCLNVDPPGAVTAA